jgi:hypothetical protein
VSEAVWRFSVSDFFVVESWVKSRLRDRGGRRSSALDDIRPEQWTAGMTQELLELIWIVEATLTMQPELNMVLAHIIDGPLLVAADLPLPTAAECRSGATGLSGRFTEGFSLRRLHEIDNVAEVGGVAPVS